MKHLPAHAPSQGRLLTRGFIGPKLDLLAQNWLRTTIAPYLRSSNDVDDDVDTNDDDLIISDDYVMMMMMMIMR